MADNGSAPGGAHKLGHMYLLDPVLGARRSSARIRRAWARQEHFVELRSWRDLSYGGFLVEALCGHVNLRARFDCERSLADHDAEDIAAVLLATVAEHVQRCPNRRPARQRLVQLS